jgi:FSR family fosmidomycin resistance protein-like MFS transporter
MPGYWAMVACLTIGALGSGALHATGMVNASAAGGHYPTIATSVFFVMGQSGLALGPFLAGVLLQTVGLQAAMPAMALITLPSIVLMFIFLREPIEDEVHHAPTRVGSQTDSGQSSQGASRGAFVATAFVLVIALRAAAMQSFSTLLPKYFSDLGYDPAFYGMLLGVLTFGGALGTFGGGFMGDHFNRRMVIFASTVFSVPFLLGLLHTSGWVIFAAAALAGALLNIPHSVLLVMAQRLLPRRKGLMGGATLGFMFASGAVAAWIAAWFADSLGLATVLNIVALLPIGAGACALLLPSTRQTTTKAVAQPITSAAD